MATSEAAMMAAGILQIERTADDEAEWRSPPLTPLDPKCSWCGALGSEAGRLGRTVETAERVSLPGRLSGAAANRMSARNPKSVNAVSRIGVLLVALMAQGS